MADAVRDSGPGHTPLSNSPATVSAESGSLTASGRGPLPTYLGRYRVVAALGAGAFGVVYQAYDEELHRDVAVKVPHAHRVARPGDSEAYLAEARALAALDHPHIVTVHDVGRDAGGVPFVVSRLIEGGDLAARLRRGRFAPAEAAALVAAVADALHYAHRHGLVHRDIKPGNILMGPAGDPCVADFGLALHEEDFGLGARYAGTPAYMSPEQARGEGHRVDGRSDVFSLGVVFYELLTGRRPFRADTTTALLGQILATDARPPRQLDDSIPPALERACLKALSRRATDRYPTARDFADDLRAFLAGPPAPAAEPPAGPGPARVVPRGLRPFDAGDADFFLDLLPGPRDRDGLPESLRFWKARVEETDAAQTFPVGLLYGPSGGGKSSLVRAGLLPRLAAHVTAVVVECAAGGTEARLLAGLRRKCPELRADAGLAEAVAALRREAVPGRKVLVVLDQFEQWLHARGGEAEAQLVAALRQCDGGRVQCLLLVRDDFWMAATRVLRELEVPPREGENAAAADLFDARHARHVLALFGRAFGALGPADETAEQAAFLDRAVAGLAEDGRIVPVRLAVFAEMVKRRPWRPATLREVGGTEGVGVAFLEGAFDAPTAPPGQRLHRDAARAVLKALLPADGADLRGAARSRRELAEAAGPAGLDELLRILDRDLRLVSPAAAEGEEPFYQLTHDYLVPSVRDWLTRHQRATRRGRAELRLAERAALWGRKPERRHLPSWWEWAAFRLLTRPRDWTESQRRMMRTAGRYHALRGLVLAAVLAAVAWGGGEYLGRARAEALRDRLVSAETADVPAVVADLGPYRRWADPLLREALDQARAAGDAKKQLHLAVALLPSGPGLADYLFERLLAAGPQELAVIRSALEPRKDELTEKLWAELADRAGHPDRRFRAACALAAYAPDDPRWPGHGGEVAAWLLAENPLVLAHWTEVLRPVGRPLLPALADFLGEEARGEGERRTTAQLYREFAADRPEEFARLERQLAEKPADGASPEARLALARRQANVGAALVAMGHGDAVWPLLVHTPDPTTRSYLIERLAPGGADPRVLEDRLGREPNVSVRRALILALGGFGPDRLPPGERDRLAPGLLRLYADDPDPGVHGAAEWLLRQWGHGDRLREAVAPLATGQPEGGRGWFVNREKQTMVVIRGPVDSWRGDRLKPEKQRIDYTFAIAAKEVTVEEFLRFKADHKYSTETAQTLDCPVNQVTWYLAAEYCNELSRRDGLPESEWCYVAVGPTNSGELGLRRRYLELKGYRLPTEAEWRYSAAAEATTPWPCGEGDHRLVARYAWLFPDSTIDGKERSSPACTTKPNDFGLFDTYGNVNEWALDFWIPPTPGQAAPSTDVIRIERNKAWAVLGGSFVQRFSNLGPVDRTGLYPTRPDSNLGFRPARTVR